MITKRHLLIIMILSLFTSSICVAQILGNTKGDFLQIGVLSGASSNSFKNFSWLLRDADGGDWYTARLHDGIAVDASFLTPVVNTKTWWERDPHDNIQSWGSGSATYLTIVAGNVGIGTTSPKAKLAVEGAILAKEVKVKTDISVPDYVFEPDHKLSTLAEIEAYVKQHKHLPEIPSAKDIEQDGLNLAEMNLLLLKKVEELTLYIIDLNRTNELQNKEIAELKSASGL